MNLISILLIIFLGISSPIVASQEKPLSHQPPHDETLLNRTKIPLSEEKINQTIATKARQVAEYTLLVIMEGDNNLNSMGDFNLKQMMQVPSCAAVNILVQRHKPGSNATHRYKVECGKIYDAGSINQPLGINPEQEVFEAAEWATREFPSRKLILDLWNHGGGAEEKGGKKGWLLPAGAEQPLEATKDVSKETSTAIELPEGQKGILYSDTTGKYLSNEAFSRVCSRISRELLGGRKIDIIGCDACLMQGIEIAYGIKNSAEYLVASTNVEAGQGWAYDDFLGELVRRRGMMSSDEVCHKIVEAYATFYATIDKAYTQSYVKLANINPVLDGINSIVINLQNLKSYSREIAKNMLGTVCTNSMYFHDNYADLYTFADETGKTAAKYYSVYIKYSNQPGYREIINCLLSLSREVVNLKNAIKNFVMHTRAGSQFPGSSGVSIYLPKFTQYYPTSSYITSLFGRNSMWSKLLTMFSYEMRDARDFLDVPELKPENKPDAA